MKHNTSYGPVLCRHQFVWISAFSSKEWREDTTSHVLEPVGNLPRQHCSMGVKLLWSKAISKTFCSSSRSMLFKVITAILCPNIPLELSVNVDEELKIGFNLFQTGLFFTRKDSILYHVMPCPHHLIVAPNYNPGLYVIWPKITAASSGGRDQGLLSGILETSFCCWYIKYLID